jgi:hypothetical protein
VNQCPENNVFCRGKRRSAIREGTQMEEKISCNSIINLKYNFLKHELKIRFSVSK